MATPRTAKRDKPGKPLRDKDGKAQTLTSHTLNPVTALRTVSSSDTDRLGPVLKLSTCMLQSPLEVLGSGSARPPGRRPRERCCDGHEPSWISGP
jgi:hypothetical protein